MLPLDDALDAARVCTYLLFIIMLMLAGVGKWSTLPLPLNRYKASSK